MPNNNVIFDIDVVVDLLANRQPASHAARAAFEKALHAGCQLWLVAACLPTLLERLEKAFQATTDDTGKEAIHSTVSSRARETLRSFLKKVSVLSSHGFHAEAAFESDRPMGALILYAADALTDDVEILSRDPSLLRADKRVVEPQTYAGQEDLTSQPEEPIPFVDLARQQHRILTKVEKSISKVLRHGQYIMGPEIKELERKLAEYVGVEHAICCASGTDALLLALMAYGVGPGDAIFTSPFTFISTAEVISLLGATPVFVDIDPRTFNIDPGCLKSAIKACKENNPGMYPLPAIPVNSPTPLEPKGVIPVDLFGLPVDYDRVNAIAAEHGLFVIEDAAQSFGAEYHGKRACSLGDIGCTSFFPAKPLGCYGDGGAVFTEDGDLAETMISMRVHGKGTDNYDNTRIGLNARMDTLQAAFLLPKLEIFPEEIVSRNRAAARYTEQLSPYESLQTPRVPEGLQSAWAQYSLLANRREDVQSALRAKGIPTAVYYPKPLHLQTAYRGLGYKEGDFPESESASRRIFSLPMHPYLSDEQIRRIAHELTMALEALQ
jgi:UDP-2-acetamido-2-deoxy-ribo-hexuluronate aminotransferase